MRVLIDPAFLSPAQQLALEQAVLSLVAEGDVPPSLRLWRNGRCVVVGRSQRVEDEVDLPLCGALDVPVLRRASGGGAVYHHPGNLNFSLYLPLTGRWTSVRGSQAELSGLLAEALQRRLGVVTEARAGAVFMDGFKVSGSAQLRRRALLHHGTLLLWSDRLDMARLLRAMQPGYRPRAVPSHPAPTADLSGLTGRPVTLHEGLGLVLSAYRSLGVLRVQPLTLREWARADAIEQASRRPLWTETPQTAT